MIIILAIGALAEAMSGNWFWAAYFASASGMFLSLGAWRTVVPMVAH